MSEELPKGWVKTKLGEVCIPVETIQPGDTPDAEFTYFDIGGIDNEANRIAETKTVTGRNAPSRARQAVRKDDILFSTVRTYLRKIARVEREYPNPVASTGFTVIRAAEGVSSQFLFFQVLSENFLQPLHKLQTGTSYPAVRDRDVRDQSILLPPAKEQERIVAKLTAALSAVSRAEMAARRGRERLLRYRAAVLQAAVTGELTRDWREVQQKNEKAKLESGDTLLRRLLAARRHLWEEAELNRRSSAGKVPKDDNWKSRYPEPNEPKIADLSALPEGWTWISPEQLSSGNRYSLAIGPFGSNLKVSDYRDSGVPLIFVRNIRTAGFFGEDTRFISQKKAQELVAHQVTGGDILIAKMGDPPGDACLYPENAPTAIITADCIRLQLSPLLGTVKPIFVHFINSKHGRDQIREITMGVAQQKVSLSRFSSIALPLPPLAEQIEIIREVEHRLSAADRLEEVLKQQFDRSLSARRTLLNEAFAGHLVPQDPNDEPASALMERIRAAREADTRKPKGKGMPKPRSSKKGIIRRPLLTVLQENGDPMTPEELFHTSGYSQESIDNFFAELRTLTNHPAKVAEERRASGQILLRVLR